MGDVSASRVHLCRLSLPALGCVLSAGFPAGAEQLLLATTVVCPRLAHSDPQHGKVVTVMYLWLARVRLSQQQHS